MPGASLRPLPATRPPVAGQGHGFGGRGGHITGQLGLPLALLLVALGSAAHGAAAEELHYGIVFDAGSSGSRIHVYTWRDAAEPGGFDLVEDDLVKAKPGLSAFAREPGAAGASLESLLEHAQQKIPPERHGSSPVFLMATAGLRLLGEQLATAILKSVGETLAASPFLFRREWVTIIPGSDEGVYGWITVNYLLGALAGKERHATSGVIDLGGGSVQLVYALPPDSSEPAAHVREVSFGGGAHRLYVQSHLGFGLDEVRTRAAKRLLEDSGTTLQAVRHPCLPLGVQVSLAVGSDLRHAFVGTGSFGNCTDLLRGLVRCAGPSCAFSRDPQLPLPKVLFGCSYLYDRTRAIGLLDGDVQAFGTQQMSLQDIRAAAAKLCAAPPQDSEQRFASCEDASEWTNFCGDAAYIAVLLEHGFGIEPKVNLTMGNKVGGVEVVWTLGAIIAKSAMLSADPTREEL